MDRGAITHNLFSWDFKQAGKRAIRLQITFEVVQGRPGSGMVVDTRCPWAVHSSVSQPDVGHNHNTGRLPYDDHIPPNQHFMDYSVTVVDAG